VGLPKSKAKAASAYSFGSLVKVARGISRSGEAGFDARRPRGDGNERVQRRQHKRDRRPNIRRTLFGTRRRAATGAPAKLKIPGDGFELAHHRPRRLALPVRRGVETMIDMVMDQLPFGLPYGFFDRVKLLGELKARPALAEHRDDFSDMPFGAFEPLDDFRVAFMEARFRHG
jgi:hypothetical protein